MSPWNTSECDLSSWIGHFLSVCLSSVSLDCSQASVVLRRNSHKFVLCVCVFCQTHCSIHPVWTQTHRSGGTHCARYRAQLGTETTGSTCVCVCLFPPTWCASCYAQRDNVSSSFSLHETLWAIWLSSVLCSKNLLHHVCLLSNVLCLHIPFTHFDLHTKALHCVCAAWNAPSFICLQHSSNCLDAYKTLDISNSLCLVTHEFCVLSLKWWCWKILCVKFQVFFCFYLQVIQIMFNALNYVIQTSLLSPCVLPGVGTCCSHGETKHTATQIKCPPRWQK